MKLRTSKSTSKRVTITKNGKIRARRLSAQHLAAGKSKRTLRAKSKKLSLKKADVNNIKKLVPYA